jgi:prevent-host-death family protein
MASHIVTATEFKAKCLALIDEVSKTGGTITVTKRGTPVVTLARIPKRRRSSEGILAGKIHIPDEILMADNSDMYECVTDPGRFF